jgi:hypothetical protein
MPYALNESNMNKPTNQPTNLYHTHISLRNIAMKTAISLINYNYMSFPAFFSVVRLIFFLESKLLKSKGKSDVGRPDRRW